MAMIELENGELVTSRFFKVLQKKVSGPMVKRFDYILKPAGFKLLTRKQVIAHDWDPEPHPNVRIWVTKDHEMVEVHSDGSWLASFTASSGRSSDSLQRKLIAAQKSFAAGNGFHSEKE